MPGPLTGFAAKRGEDISEEKGECVGKREGRAEKKKGADGK